MFFSIRANCCTRALERVVDVVRMVFQAKPETGFLKDSIDNIDTQETKDKPTLVGASVVCLNCQALWQLFVLLIHRVHHREDRLARVIATLDTKLVCHYADTAKNAFRQHMTYKQDRSQQMPNLSSLRNFCHDRHMYFYHTCHMHNCYYFSAELRQRNQS